MDYTRNLESLMDLYRKLKDEPSVQSTTVDFWLASFIRWRNTTYHAASLKTDSKSTTDYVSPPHLSFNKNNSNIVLEPSNISNIFPHSEIDPGLYSEENHCRT